MINPLKKQNEFYFDIESIIYYTHGGCIVERSFLKLKYFCELFMVNNNSREVKWLGDSIYIEKSCWMRLISMI
jgi:hypothetical protein